MTAPKNKGGRPPGSRNKTPANRRLAARLSQQQPLDYLLEVMANQENSQAVRVDAAARAAPYCHARLSAVTVEQKPFEGDPNELTNEYLASIIARGSSGDDAPAKKGKQVTH